MTDEQGLRRVAASRIYFNEKEFCNNHIVELFNRFVINHFALHDELAMTEWLGGVIVITSADIAPDDLRTISSIADFYTHCDTSVRHKYAYHISAFNLTSGTLTPSSVITQL